MDDWKKKAEAIFSRIGMIHHLGIRLTEVTEDEAEMELVVDDRHMNYLGGLHGGAVATLADTVAFFPGALLPSGRRFATEGVELHFFRPAAEGERIRCRAKILRNGRRVVTVEVRTHGEKDKQISHGIVTLLDLEA